MKGIIIEGAIYYHCWLCKKVFSLLTGRRLKEQDVVYEDWLKNANTERV